MSVSKFKFMLLVVVLNALLQSEIAASSASQVNESSVLPKIINGRDALPGEFPSFITLVRGFNTLECSAVLIDESLVLTAAHCLPDGVEDVDASTDIRHPSTWKPEMDIERIKVVKACRSKQWNVLELTHDYQVLRLQEPFADVKPAKLNDDQNMIGQEVTVVGMGQNSDPEITYPETLQALSVNIIECKYGSDRHQTKICSKSETGSQFYGDSGGPLYKQLGPNEQAVVALTSYFSESPVYGLVNAEISRNLEEIQELMLECSN